MDSGYVVLYFFVGFLAVITILVPIAFVARFFICDKKDMECTETDNSGTDTDDDNVG